MSFEVEVGGGKKEEGRLEGEKKAGGEELWVVRVVSFAFSLARASSREEDGKGRKRTREEKEGGVAKEEKPFFFLVAEKASEE